MRKSRITLWTTPLLLLAALTTTACPDGDAENAAEEAGEAVDEAVESAGDAVKEAADKVEDATDGDD